MWEILYLCLSLFLSVSLSLSLYLPLSLSVSLCLFISLSVSLSVSLSLCLSGSYPLTAKLLFAPVKLIVPPLFTQRHLSPISIVLAFPPLFTSPTVTTPPPFPSHFGSSPPSFLSPLTSWDTLEWRVTLQDIFLVITYFRGAPETNKDKDKKEGSKPIRIRMKWGPLA